MKPSELLPDDNNELNVNGTTVRKGTIGAFIRNVLTIQSSNPDTSEFQQAVVDLKQSIPSLELLQVFDVFSIKDEFIRKLVLDVNPTLKV